MANIRQAADSLDRILALAAQAERIGKGDLQVALRQGQPEAQSMARKFLAAAYKRSGLKSRTGQLLGMVKRSVLNLEDAATGRPAIVIEMPGGAKKEDYVKANSLNYGAVRGKKDSLLNAKGSTGKKLIGWRKRQTLKGLAQSSKDSVTKGLVTAYKGKTTKAGSVEVTSTVGNYTATKAWKFYQLTNKQIDEIKNVLFSRALEYIQKKLGKSLRRAA